MDALTTQIQDSFSATQILLVFITIFFGLKYQEVKNLVNEKIPNDPNDLIDFRKKINSTLKFGCGILLAVLIIIFILFFPLLYSVIINAFQYIYSNPNPIQYNFIQTSFFTIDLMILGFIIWSLILINELFEFRKKAE
jgi:hypothetical protein